MNTKLLLRCHVLLLCISFVSDADSAVRWSDDEDFSNLTTAVVRLLETGDAAAFANTVSPTMEDWRATVSTNRNTQGENSLDASWEASLKRQRTTVESAATELLTKAKAWNVDFSQLRLTAKAIPPRSKTSVRYGEVLPENEMLPWAQKLTIVVSAVPTNDTPETARLTGDYAVGLSAVIKLATGWRCMQGMQWDLLPDAVGDQETRIEIAILAQASDHKGLTQNNDPALIELGAALKQFLQTRDPNVYEQQTMVSLPALAGMTERQAAMMGRTPPSRADLEQHWNTLRDTMMASARKIVALMEEAGVDLGDARIELKETRFDYINTGMGSGTIDGLRGGRLTVTFSVESGRESKSGKNLSGEYALAASEALRLDGRWLVSREIRWEQLPDGIVDAVTQKELEFESHVAKHGTLPPNTPAPDIEFIGVDNGQKLKLSDLRGKVVILDFWATWCGPCQEPMAQMQKYREQNPDWKDRVAVVSLSIDDELKTARDHLAKRGWTNTFNVWGDEGGWQCTPAKSFRVRGVPTCYVIGADGNIVKAGHPMSLHAPDVVNGLLK